MNTKFFTNESDNTLLKKIEGIFKHRHIYFFDALVGYFRASGYFRIRKFIEKSEEIRILVGINIDNLIYHAYQQGILFSEDIERTQEEFFLQIKKNIQTATYDKDVEEGMTQLIEDIITRKVQIRIHPKQNIHAKIYIFREKDKHDHGYGAVITGSSNLTDAGLSHNFEFNVELRDNTDIEFANMTFEKLWTESVPIASEYIEKLKKETFLNDTFTPYEVYLKFLIEYFGKSIDFDPNSITDLPKGFKRLSYQIDAVNDGYSKMMQHNGFFLADVVGLGKTIVATLIAKKYFYSNGFPTYRSRTLIVVPPALKDNWEETINKFRLDNVDILTNGSLHKVVNPEKYDLIIVDEAHKFRSDTADMYNDLQKLCKSPTRKVMPNGTRETKRVLLISATPLNNRPDDIANQVYLFQDSKNSTLEIGNLQHFFRQHIDAYKKLKTEKNIEHVKEEVKRIYDKIRVKVIEPLTVRRTRTDLTIHKQYAEDLAKQGIQFPVVRKPEKIFYELEPHLELLYDKTIRCLVHPTEGLTYNRYRAIGFLKPHKKNKYQKADIVSSQLAKIMKTLLVKRIDSSFYAFKQSLERFLKATKAMVSMFEKGRIYIAPNLPVSDYINNGQEEELLNLILDKSPEDPTIEICEPDDFEHEFIIGLKKDYHLLNELHRDWKEIEKDPKLDVFVEYLESRLFDKRNPQQKLVIFSESKETTIYLKEKLQGRIDRRIITVDSSSRKDRMPIIRENFDANYPVNEQQNNYDIVISTEVLAEGVNLHRANIIINYDTPWNSTRLMQRIGRVNRIGSIAGEVHIFNFFPTAKVNTEIELEKKAIMKLQAFHAALGEDSQIYSPDEETQSFGIFDHAIEEEKDEKLVYLMRIRDIREKQPDLFKTVSNMPLRARVGRKSRILRESTISFIRTGRRDAFLYVKANGEIEELTFLETARQFEAKMEERRLDLHSKHHEQVQQAMAYFVSAVEAEKIRDKKVDVTQGPNEKEALIYLDAFLHLPFANELEKELIIEAKEAIRKGKFQNLQRDVNKLRKAVKKTPLSSIVLLERLITILRSYPLEKVKDDLIPDPLPAAINQFNPDIIITESFSV